jgi:hypothetical protein
LRVRVAAAITTVMRKSSLPAVYANTAVGFFCASHRNSQKSTLT